MPRLSMHLADERHYDALNHIWAHVYGDGDTSEALDPPGEGTSFWIGYCDDTPAWAAQVHTYQIVRRPWPFTLKCAGVAAVATLVEHRNSGLAQHCMHQLLLEARSAGFDVSMLYAYRDSFYRKVGYAACGWRWRIKVPATRMPKTESVLTARQVRPEDAETVLGPCHRQFIETFSGSSRRDAVDWKDRLGKKPPFIYAVGDPVEAYFWARPQGFWNELEIGEFAWSTRRGYNAALAVVRGMANNQTHVIWNEPPRSPYLARHIDHGTEVSVHRPTMARVLDWPGLVAKIPGGEGLVVEVDDPWIAENNGRWACGPSPRRTDAETNASGPVSAWAQALFGEPSLEDLMIEGDLAIETSHADELKAWMPASPVVCMEFY
ncbi:MAG: GNAT family N-acetyltransferase [Fimbriimonadaceae bacterium]|nr:GNAT family N-acetyltransferase [Fimbriimonadaceae bacterium]